MKALGKNKLVNAHIYNLKDRIDEEDNNFEIEILFNSFERPVIQCSDDELMIVVDNNFDYDEYNDNVIFIDHHLMETEHDTKYSSNGLMMIDNYEEIYNEIQNILDTKCIKKITIFGHCDLDGIASVIITKAILNKQKDKEPLMMLKILSEYGDIGDNPEKNLDCVIENDYVDVYAKKIKSWTSCFGKFMKAIRPMLLENYMSEDCFSIKPIENEYNIISKKYGISSVDTIDFVNKMIYKPIVDMKVVNLQNIILYMDNISQSYLFNSIVNMFNDEAERLTNGFLAPDNAGATEMIIRFKIKPEISYKLLVISSPFDLGRSVEWKYRIGVWKQCKNYSVSPWYFKFNDYLSQMDVMNISRNKENYNLYDSQNMICYNSFIGKVSMDGDFAFEICSEAFEGGGHCSDEMSNNSLGSALINNYNDFTDSFIIQKVR